MWEFVDDGLSVLSNLIRPEAYGDKSHAAASLLSSSTALILVGILEFMENFSKIKDRCL